MSVHTGETPPKGMSQRNLAEDSHLQLKKYDKSRDIQVVLGVTIAVIAAIAAITGVIAVYAVGFLETFRKDVSSVWLTCIPFCFPVITGVGVAYRRQMSSIGVHLVMLLATLVAGGIGYGFSIEPVFVNRANCTIISVTRGECHRETLVHLYVIAGAISAAFGVIGLLLSMLACKVAVKRRKVKMENMRIEEEKMQKRELELKSARLQPKANAIVKSTTKTSIFTENGEAGRSGIINGGASNQSIAPLAKESRASAASDMASCDKIFVIVDNTMDNTKL